MIPVWDMKVKTHFAAHTYGPKSHVEENDVPVCFAHAALEYNVVSGRAPLQA